MRASIVQVDSGVSVGTRTYRNRQALTRYGVGPIVRQAQGADCLVTMSDGQSRILWSGPTGRIHEKL